MPDEDIKNFLSLVIFLTTMALPEKLLTCLIDKLRINFDIEINEANYQKENIYFKVPESLKR